MSEVFIDTDERLDEVVGTDLKLIQKIDGTAFAIDTVLLAHFVALGQAVGRIAELGSGSGILCFLLKYRKPSLQLVGFEILDEFHLLSKRNLELNPGMKGISFELADVREIPSRILPETFDLVIANPPYYPKGTGKIPERQGRAIARHELAGTLKDFIDAASYLLPYGSRLAMVIPANRFYEALGLLKEVNLGLRRARFVIPKEGQNASLSLFEAEKFYNGVHEPLPDLVIRMEDGRFSDEVNRIFSVGFRPGN